MKLKQLLIVLLAVTVTLLTAACAVKNDTTGTASTDITLVDGSGSDTTTTPSAVTIAEQDGAYFADGDLKDVASETPNATVTLSGSTGTISDTTRGSSGDTVTITAKGIYRVTGSSENVSIVINDTQESGNIYLVLDGVTMTNATAPCIIVEAADKVVIQCVGDNSLTYTAASADYDGAIYAKDDLTVNGTGSLSITSALHGIVGKDDVKITGAALTITAGSIGIKANDSVRIGGGTISVSAGHDGIKIKSDDGTGYFYMDAGTLTVSAGYDGIDVGADEEDGASAANYSGYVLIRGGIVDVTAGGGASHSKNASTSQKGIKCDGDLLIEAAATVNVSSADDALHSATTIAIADGTVNVASSDDGIHADSALQISGGTVTVSQSYEGLEAYEVTISGGTISVTASDDGVNAAGGSDTTSTDTRPGGWGASSSGILTISGGDLYVNARGDGLDSNGSLYVTGGTVIVEGPTDNGNGALDIGENGCVASITGGTVLAIGSTGMAVNFNTGTQCAALVGLSGSAGTTITVDDGSGFTFTATKSFSCIVYSSPLLTEGSTYTVSAGSSSATMDFSSGLFYATVSGMGGGMGGPGGQPGGGMTPPQGGFGRP